MAARLLSAGERDLLVLERAGEVGGVWRDNVYPGCVCDVPSHLYALSFAPNPYWTHRYAPQPEIQSYLTDCAHRFGILPHLRFDHEVTGMSWHEDRQRWHIETPRGDFMSEVVVVCTGAFSEPQTLPLDGIETFDGKVMHSARWDRSYDLRGKRVAVIGTGASAIQIIPEIQPLVEKLVVFQRTPQWVLHLGNRPISASIQRLFAAVPPVQRLVRRLIYLTHESLVLALIVPRLTRSVTRYALRRLERKVADAALRKSVTPNYAVGCKRVLRSDNYLSCLANANVEIVTDAIREVGRHSIVTVQGARYDVDAIVFATGFLVSELSLARVISGRGGLTLAESWNGSPKAHVGTTVSGFPSLFLLLGPNTGVGHSSVLETIEAQMDHVIGALQCMKHHDLAAVEPLPAAQAAFVAAVDKKMRGTVWEQDRCRSYYYDRSGRNFVIWPGFIGAFRRRVAHFDRSEYSAVPRRNVGTMRVSDEPDPEVINTPRMHD